MVRNATTPSVTEPRTLPDAVSTTLFIACPPAFPGKHARMGVEGKGGFRQNSASSGFGRARRMIKHPGKYQDFEDPQAHPRYTGIATFFRTPASQDLGDVDIGVIGVPFDGGVTNRSGTRHGPRAVREQSTMLRRINAATRVSPFASARVRDLGDCWIEQPYEIQGALGEIEAFYRSVAGAGVVPLSVGGDHAISLPILRAVAAQRK